MHKTIKLDDSVHAYILKPYSKPKANKDNYFTHISLNEHLFMFFAKNTLGFRVPYSAIVKNEKDDEFHYIVKRFDRLGLHRYDKSTFAVFLGLNILVFDENSDFTKRKDNKIDAFLEDSIRVFGNIYMRDFGFNSGNKTISLTRKQDNFPNKNLIVS